MQCVILAAGKGTRMLPLTLECPKPLLGVRGIPILEYVIDALPAEIDEVILVVGYLADKIRAHFGDEWKERKISYVIQESQEGTAHALELCKDLIKDRFMVMLGDDIHGYAALRRLSAHTASILGAYSNHPERFGALLLNNDGTLKGIEEKSDRPTNNLVSTGVFILDKRIFDYKTTPINGEYYLPHLVEQYAKETPVHVEIQERWIPIGYPEDIAKAESIISTWTF